MLLFLMYGSRFTYVDETHCDYTFDSNFDNLLSRQFSMCMFCFFFLLQTFAGWFCCFLIKADCKLLYILWLQGLGDGDAADVDFLICCSFFVSPFNFYLLFLFWGKRTWLFFSVPFQSLDTLLVLFKCEQMLSYWMALH